MLMSIATLLRNTTWKCGKIERRVVKYLQRRNQRCGSAQTPVKDMMQHFELDGKQKSEFLEAIRRLEKRNIIKISWLQRHNFLQPTHHVFTQHTSDKALKVEASPRNWGMMQPSQTDLNGNEDYKADRPLSLNVTGIMYMEGSNFGFLTCCLANRVRRKL